MQQTFIINQLLSPTLLKMKQEPEEDENADDTGDYMPPLLQGHRVTLEGKFKHISFY